MHQSYAPFGSREAVLKYCSNLKPAQAAKVRQQYGLDQPVPETTMQTLQRMAAGNPVAEAKVALLQRIPNGTPTEPQQPAAPVIQPKVAPFQGAVGAVQFTLPFPPSMNTYWRSVIMPAFKGATRIEDLRIRVLISKQGRQYRSAVLNIIHRQDIPKMPVGCRIRLLIEIHPPDKRARDLDNLPKSIQDAISKANLWADDSLIDELVVVRRGIVKGGKAVVTIVPILEGRLL